MEAENSDRCRLSAHVCVFYVRIRAHARAHCCVSALILPSKVRQHAASVQKANEQAATPQRPGQIRCLPLAFVLITPQ